MADMCSLLSEDLLDELYTLSSDCWLDGIEKILSLLKFSVIWHEIYDDGLSARYQRDKVNIQQLRKLECCEDVIVGDLLIGNDEVKCVLLKLKDGSCCKTELASTVCKKITTLWGRYVVSIYYSNGSFAFGGVELITRRMMRTVISEWFAFAGGGEVSNRLAQVESSQFLCSSSHEWYSDYLYAIMRSYVKREESESHLKCFGSFAFNNICEKNSRNYYLYTTMDWNKIIHRRKTFYRDLCGNEYFDTWDIFIVKLKKSNKKFDNKQDDEELDDLAWFRLEQELEQDPVDDEEDNHELSFDFVWDDENEEDNDSYIKDENEGLADMNPEEMLEFLKNK